MLLFSFLLGLKGSKNTNYRQSRLRAVSLILVRRAKRERHENDHARVVSRVFSPLHRSMLARARTPLTKSEEKKRLLAGYRQR